MAEAAGDGLALIAILRAFLLRLVGETETQQPRALTHSDR
jgi:hypothetical protein